MASIGISKFRIAARKQCPKKLWLQVNRRDLLDYSDKAERGFQIGYEVEEVARNLHSNGILIEHNDDLSEAVKVTKATTAAFPDRPIFEAAFQHEGLLVRTDLLLPVTTGYRMVEIKSSASVKPYHLNDCAIQSWVLKQNNIPIDSVELAHIDTSFMYQGDGNYHGLFHYEKLDEVIQPLMEQVPHWIKEARSTLLGEEPDIEIGAQCDDPFECPFKEYCSRNIVKEEQPQFSLDVLYRMRESSKEDLRSKGFEDVCLVPPELLNPTQQWIQRVSQTGVAELSKNASLALEELPYPHYYLDFETITLAVPRWANTRPYSTQVPFQWSCHIHNPAFGSKWNMRVNIDHGILEHEMFLDVSGEDPRRSCAEQLIIALGTEGPIFVYYESFEKSRISELAQLFPDLAPRLAAINERIIDLLPIVRSNYYHPDMKGSWSIKAVLSTIAPDLDYSKLMVGNGGDAQEAYREIVHPNTPDQRRKELTEGLREYCTLDTLAMVRLHWFLLGWNIKVLDVTKLHYYCDLKSTDQVNITPNTLQLKAIEVLRKRCQLSQSNIIIGPISTLQRELKLSYSKTLKLIAELETLGIFLFQ